MLTKGQVNQISRIIKKRSIKNFSMEEELIDFVSCEVEARIASGHSFEDALAEVMATIPMGSNTRNRELEKLSKTSSMDMIQNYIKVSWRNLSRYKVNTSMNIFGLVLSLTATIILGLYLKHEYSFDRHYPEVDRLYRVNAVSNLGQTPTHMTSVSAKLIPEVQKNIPEVESSSNFLLAIVNQPLKWRDKTFFDYHLGGVRSDFTELFGFKAVEGDIGRTFTNLNTVIVSETKARQIFGDISPIGEYIEINVNGKTLTFEVAAVYQDLPSNSHLERGEWTRFDFLVSIKTAEVFSTNQASWTSINGSAYVRLSTDAVPEQIAEKINKLVADNYGGDIWYQHYLQPVSDIHLNRRELSIGSEGNLAQLRLFILIGIVIIVIACINYINLTTAQASVRLKEVGVRKAIGAKRSQFLLQFFVEALMTSFLSMAIAMGLVLFLIPLLNREFSLVLDLRTVDSINLLGFTGLTLFVSLLCGTYPGLFLSRIKANVLLKSGTAVKSGGGLFRRAMVGLQFVTSIALVVATLIITEQMDFINQKDLGFDKEQVVYLPIDYRVSTKYGDLLFKKVDEKAGVVAASLTGNSLGDGDMAGNGITVKGVDMGGGNQMHQVLAVDDGFYKALGLQMKEGRWFSSEFPSDRAEGFVVNESFVAYFGLKDPVGRIINRNGQEGKILGVVKDYHFKSMHNAIEPLVMHQVDRAEYGYTNIAVRLAPNSTQATLKELEKVWKEVIPDFPFQVEFLDDKIDQYYKSDRHFATVFKAFATLAITVSCLGLVGLVAFNTERKRKEIGVRKVLGASVMSILRMLSGEYLKLILIAALIAMPIAYYAMDSWLTNFEFRTSIKPYVFLLGIGITLCLSWASISYLSLKAAKSNPADTLRTD